MTSVTKKTKEQVFWDWFAHNEAKLYDFEIDREPIFDEISENLSAYSEGLVLEISTETKGKREFIISADGIEELFPAVERLVAASPTFDRWSIVAFRPRVADYARFTLNFDERTLDPSKMWIDYEVADDNFDLIIYHPDYNEDERDSSSTALTSFWTWRWVNTP